MSDKTIEVLEKIAKELEIANKLKIYELVVSNHVLKLETFIKFYSKSADLENEIKTKMKE